MPTTIPFWSRGQAWALYGYPGAVFFAFTKNPAHTCNGHTTVICFRPPQPAGNLVPYWDMKAPGIPDIPRDASAAANHELPALYETPHLRFSKNLAEFATQSIADKIVDSLNRTIRPSREQLITSCSLLHPDTIREVMKLMCPFNYAPTIIICEALARKVLLKQ